MKFLNYGSINIDKVYSLNHIVKKGETISTSSYNLFPGGKGANQSVALANAGCEVYHAGKDGAYYAYKNIKEFASIVDANKIDTTAAGDTFLGFFLANFSININPQKALEYASLASSKTISRKGAIPSIPLKNELIL